MPTENMYESSGTGFGHWIQYKDMNAHWEYVGNIGHWNWALDSVWKYECPLRMYMKYRTMDSVWRYECPLRMYMKY